MIPDNARTLRITAAAGTELAGPYSYGTVTGVRVPLVLPVQKRFTTRRAFFPHAAWLDQAPAHCPIFLTAASRRSLVRVSVPVWGAPLSGPLTIGAMVGRYPAIELMVRMAIRYRPEGLWTPRDAAKGQHGALIRVSPGYSPVTGRFHTRCAPVRRSPTLCKHRSLPLDLHVLGLPLAFILSQDQTLHRCALYIINAPREGPPPAPSLPVLIESSPGRRPWRPAARNINCMAPPAVPPGGILVVSTVCQ